MQSSHQLASWLGANLHEIDVLGVASGGLQIELVTKAIHFPIRHGSAIVILAAQAKRAFMRLATNLS